MKNKVIFIFSLLVLISFIFIFNNSFATTGTVTYNNETLDLSTLPFDTQEHPNFVVIYNVINNYFCVGYTVSDNVSRFFIGTTNNINGVTYYIDNTTTQEQWYYYKLQNGAWSSRQTTGGKTMCLYSWGGSTHEADLVYSTLDVYTDNTFSEIFFQGAPLTVLAPIVERVEMSQEITQTIVGLAGLLIPLLVSLLAFWKGWGLLSRVLFKA